MSTVYTEHPAPPATQSYCICVRGTKHGDVHMRTVRTSENTYIHYVPSARHHTVIYRVTVADGVFPIAGHCNCSATYNNRCWHIEAALKAERAVRTWLWEIARNMQYNECTDFYCEAMDLKERILKGQLEVIA